jgi:hypothetical protein
VITIWSLIDRLAAVFAEGDHKVEAIRARDEYFERAGKVFDDDGDLFEGRMASFLEWYIIERPFQGGPPPASRVATSSDARFSDDERRLAVHLATSHRILFEIANVSDKGIDIDDLLGGARFVVSERRSTAGFEPSAVFEGRVLWDGHGMVFGKTFLFHPPDARERVLDLVERAATVGVAAGDIEIRARATDELLFRLSRLHVRWHRFNHTAAAKIYAGEAGA